MIFVLVLDEQVHDELAFNSLEDELHDELA